MRETKIKNYRVWRTKILLVSVLSFSSVCQSKHLKILFVLHEFPKFVQPFIINQITGLIDKGHEIHIYANKKFGTIVPSLVQKYKLLSKTHYQKLPEGLKDFDIIYCHFGIDGYVGLELKRHYDLSGKLVVCFRGDDITQYLKRDPEDKLFKMRGPFKIPCYYSGMYTELFQKADLFLPVCHYFRHIAIHHGCNPSKIIVHHSAIDCDKFTFKKRELSKKKRVVRVISIGRLVELKGTAYLIKAMAKVKRKYPGDVRLYIVGDGPEKARLVQLTKDLKLTRNVFFLGWQSHERIKTFLLASHIFVLPSVTTKNGITEGIPNVLMEAMATGMPVIGTRHAGVTELIADKESGFLVSERNVEELAQRLLELIMHPELWESMGRAGNQYVQQHHNIKIENDELERIFYNCVEKN